MVRLEGLGLRAEGLRFRLEGLGFRVEGGSGLRGCFSCWGVGQIWGPLFGSLLIWQE